MGTPAKVLTAADLRRVIEQTSNCRDAARSRVIVLLSFKAGLRAAEIAGLDWSMVLGADGRLSDHLSIADRIAKNGSGRRIPINVELRRALAHLRRNLEQPRAEANARLNDRLRVTGIGGAIVITSGVRALPGFDAAILTGVLQRYAEFDGDNDPHGERDFGDLDVFGAELLWKIDYYDMQLEYGSPDPADPKVTKRVLTVMLASEY